MDFHIKTNIIRCSYLVLYGVRRPHRRAWHAARQISTPSHNHRRWLTSFATRLSKTPSEVLCARYKFPMHGYPGNGDQGGKMDVLSILISTKKALGVAQISPFARAVVALSPVRHMPTGEYYRPKTFPPDHVLWTPCIKDILDVNCGRGETRSRKGLKIATEIY